MDTSAETGSDEEEDEDEDEDQMYATGVGVVGKKKFMFCLSGQVGAMGMCCSSIFILISLF